MIKLDNIHKYYGKKSERLHILKGINLTIAEGEMVAIMGSSGSGKSTLLNILGILDQYDEGTYQLDDQLIAKLTEKRAAYFRNRFIGFCFQSFNLLPFKNALENVALPLYYQGVGRRERNQRAEKLLDKLGLLDRAKHMPNQLSGGQKQRIAIARALVTQPRVILADEPTGALDSKTTDEIMQVFREIHQEGTTVVIVTHESEIAAQCQRLIYLRDGCIDEQVNHQRDLQHVDLEQHKPVSD